MKTIEKIIQSSTAPLRQDVVWIDTSDPNNPVVKIYVNGKWEISQPGGGGEGYVTVKSLTKEEYDALEEKDPETLYIVKNDPTNGHEWVDLGMVDDEGYHILWATKNIGAENPWDAGKYFAWADTVGYYADEEHDFSRENAPYWDSENDEYTKYNDEGCKLEPIDDSAKILFGKNWEIPHVDDFTKLFNAGYEYRIVEEEGKTHYVKYGNDNINLYFPLGGQFVNASLSNLNTYGQYWTSYSEDGDGDATNFYLANGQHDYEGQARYLGQNIRPIIKVKDLSELDTTYDIYLGESKIVDNSTKDSNMTNILWKDLVELRDNSKLIPGRYYRIVDYNTTTSKQDTKSANHQFDVIVLATDVNKLSEDAKAIMHNNIYDVTFSDGITKRCYYKKTDEGYNNIVDCKTLLGIANIPNEELELNEITKTITDKSGRESGDLIYDGIDYSDYFSDSNLEAWEIKYCLDNDTNRFDWADNLIVPQWVSAANILDGEQLPYQGMHIIVGFESVGPVPVYGTKEQAVRFYRDETALGFVAFDPENAEVCFPTSETENLSIIIDGFIYESGQPIENINLAEDGTALGRGVIYYMKDEFENECPYDFKNIMFKRYHCAIDNQYIESQHWNAYGYLSSNTAITWTDALDIDEDDSVYAYTFCNLYCGDVSLNKYDDAISYSGLNSVFKNKITSMLVKVNVDDTPHTTQILNDIVFIKDEPYFNNINNNEIIESEKLSFSGAASNIKIEQSIDCLLFDCTNIKIEGSNNIIICSRCDNIKIGKDSNEIFISPANSDIDISNLCQHIITVSKLTIPCTLKNCKIGSNCSNIIFKGNEGLKGNWENKDFQYIYIGDGCNNLTFLNNTTEEEPYTIKYINVKEGCERLNFDTFENFNTDYEGKVCLTVGENVRPINDSGAIKISIEDDGYGCYVLPQSRPSSQINLMYPQAIAGMGTQIVYQHVY